MRDVKNSGVEWIGDIPKEWNIEKLNNVAKRITDYVASGSFADLNKNVTYLDEPDYAMLVRTADLSGTKDKKVYVNKHAYDFLANSNLHGGEIILSNIGSVGSVFYYEPLYERSTLAPNAILVDGCPNNKYIFYWFQNPIASNELKRIGGNAVQIKFNKTQLRQFKVALPPIDEQKRIVEYLDYKCSIIDSLLSKQESKLKKLKEYKLAVITEAVTKGIDPKAKMKDSGIPWIGEIPSHWEMVYAKQLFTQRKERAYDSDEQLSASQEYGIIFQSQFMELEGRQVVQVIKGEDILKHVEAGDFVISMRSFQGGLEYSEISGKISSAYVMLIPNKNYVYDRYYKWLFKSNRYITALQGTSNLIRDGQALRFSNFVQVYLPKLDIDEQKQIADYLDDICPKIDYEIEKQKEMIEKTNEYKKSLIYEVVTGKKEV